MSGNRLSAFFFGLRAFGQSGPDFENLFVLYVDGTVFYATRLAYKLCFGHRHRGYAAIAGLAVPGGHGCGSFLQAPVWFLTVQ